VTVSAVRHPSTSLTPEEALREEDATPAMMVRWRLVGHRTVLAVTGEVDLATAPELGSAVDTALASGAQELWLDLSATAFMDSSGLHVLLDAHRRMRGLRRRLAIVCPQGAVRRLFEIAGVADALPLYEDRAAAHRDV
jgi:anti-sigma B factor antagonist